MLNSSIFLLINVQSYKDLRHPKYVIENVGYKERLYRRNAWGHPWIKIGRSIEELWLNVRYGNWKFIGRSVMRRIRILTGQEKFS